MTWVAVALLALAGFLLGGAVSTWRTARPLAVVLALATALATAASITWML
ncbi:MAG TPA: hypothetical protein VFO16_05325 [Pseudonocardiaceae bacterium]|nr:hypothetical protein [Pseudonocardiaceae bacterium]